MTVMRDVSHVALDNEMHELCVWHNIIGRVFAHAYLFNCETPFLYDFLSSSFSCATAQRRPGPSHARSF